MPLAELLNDLLATQDGKRDRQRLLKAHQRAAAKDAEEERSAYIEKRGGTKWRPIKDRLTGVLGQKCWYTEVEVIGTPLTIDHYRPKRLYWWLAFDAHNFRVSCSFANSLSHNKELGVTGGKGEAFPLVDENARAANKTELGRERPLILDPCSKADCELVAFQTDGRPILNPLHAHDEIAARRLRSSQTLLNLDHADFNSKREQLYHDIMREVRSYEELPPTSTLRAEFRDRLKSRLARGAPFSKAAEYYLRTRRDLRWVEAILQELA